MLAEAEVAGRELGAAARLKNRADFLRAAKGRKVHGGLFTVQSNASNSGADAPARVGFTVTKKVGGAVERNRIRRRLREIVRITPDLSIVPSHDYVIVARRSVLTASFASLAAGLKAALRKLNGSATPRVAHDVIRPGADKPSFSA